MMFLQVAEVVETKKAHKSGQVDDEGKLLPLGSMKVRLHNDHLAGNVQTHYARPYGDPKTYPLVGEHVLVFKAPAHEHSDALHRGQKYFYIPTPLNVDNDPTYNVMQFTFHRDKSVGGRTVYPTKPGVTFPFPVRPTQFRQPYEGDTIIQNRYHASVRLSRTVKGDMSIYDVAPTWKDGKNGDPIIVMSLKDPLPGPPQMPPEYTQDKPWNREIKDTMKYSVEDAHNDPTSIYMTSTQRLPRLLPARGCPGEVHSLPIYRGPQNALNSDRAVLQAKKDNAFVIAKNKVILTGSKIRLTTNRHDVDFDDLMDVIIGIATQFKNLGTASSVFPTAAGPTGVATNASKIVKWYIKSLQFRSVCPPYNPKLPSFKAYHNLGTKGLGENSTTNVSVSATSGGSNGGGLNVNSGNSGIPGVDNNGPQSTSDGVPGGSNTGNYSGVGLGGSGTSGPNDSSVIGSPGGPGSNLGGTPPSPGTGPGSGGGGSATGSGSTPGGGSAGGGYVSGSGSYSGSGIEVYLDVKDPPVFDGGVLSCHGHLYKLVSKIKSKYGTQILDDNVYLLLISNKECGSGWYLLGSDLKNKVDIQDILSQSMVTLSRSRLIEDKPLVDSDCVSNAVQKNLYNDVYLYMSKSLVNMNKKLKINFL